MDAIELANQRFKLQAEHDMSRLKEGIESGLPLHEVNGLIEKVEATIAQWELLLPKTGSPHNPQQH